MFTDCLFLAITFNAIASYLPTAGSTYYALFSFGYTDALGQPQKKLIQATQHGTVATHTFTKAGTFTVSVSISDAPFSSGNSILATRASTSFYSNTIGGYPAPISGMTITVLDTKGNDQDNDAHF